MLQIIVLLIGLLAMAEAQSSESCSTRFRTFDGTCNAKRNRGAAGTGHLRLGTVYGGTSERPSPRLISNTVMDQNGSVPNARGMSELVTFFGQFVDHTIVDTQTDKNRRFDIKVPADDKNTKLQSLEFSRSLKTGNNPINEITSFIDASSVYGSDAARAKELRTGKDGKMKTNGKLLPHNKGGLRNDPDMSGEYFAAGDIRVNENPALTAIHTMFVIEHNIVADELAEAFPDMDDEELFMNARKIIGAELQKILYEEWLSALIGPSNALPPYTGYDPSTRPDVSVFFTTCAFRVGHTLLNDDLTLLGPGNSRLRSIPLKDAFFAPELTRTIGNDAFVRGMVNTPAQEVDTNIVDSLRNFLFTKVNKRFPNLVGFDLASRNIQRGRDNSLLDYNRARRSFRVSARRSFSDISSDSSTVSKIQSVYSNVNDVDAWVGGLAEDHIDGGSLGELLHASVVDQFRRLRDGDKFFYLAKGQFSTELREALPRVEALFDSSVSTMRDIIRTTTSVSDADLPRNVFFAS